MPTPVVTVAALTDTATEGGDGGVFRFTRTGDTTDPLGVTISVSGTATESEDFSFIGTWVTIPSGKSYADVAVKALADADGSEGSETVIVTVASGMMDYDAGSPYQATVTIEDVPAVVGVTATDTAEGSATGGFTFTRSGGDVASTLTVNYTITGTATADTDYEELSGAVVFAAGEDRAELPVEAFGDNLADDGETVILTIDTDSAYEIDDEADEATVTIADQALTVSVVRVDDSEEGGASGKFRFVRSGDLTEELTVGYTVTGTATSGTDFTSMSGTVTFEEDEDEVEVTVYVTNDGSAEATETVTVTIDEPEEEDEYLLGVDSDTIFIRDNDSPRIFWTNEGNDGLWGNPDNWRTSLGAQRVPEVGDEVFFCGTGSGQVSTAYYSNDDCTDFGDGTSGLDFEAVHIVNEYSGYVTLAESLEVNTYEQRAGILDQPEDTFDLTVKKAFIWTGGILSDTDGGADVTITGSTAVGVIDPPDEGAVLIGSTLRVISGAVVGVFPGEIEFTGGEGMYIAATVTFNHNKTTDLIVGGVTSDERKIEVAEDGRLRLIKLNDVIKGVCISDLPILNQGYIFVQDGIQFEVKGHLGGKNYPALVQTDGEFVIATGARIVAKNGITITGGDLRVHGRPENKSAAIDSTLVFAGAHILFSGDSGAMLQVNGNMTWTSGTYIPRLPRDGDPGDRLMTSGLLAIGESAVVAPDLPDPSSTAATNFWIILLTRGTVDTATVGNGYDLWKINFNWLNGVSRTWFFELS